MINKVNAQQKQNSPAFKRVIVRIATLNKKTLNVNHEYIYAPRDRVTYSIPMSKDDKKNLPEQVKNLKDLFRQVKLYWKKDNKPRGKFVAKNFAIGEVTDGQPKQVKVPIEIQPNDGRGSTWRDVSGPVIVTAFHVSKKSVPRINNPKDPKTLEKIYNAEYWKAQ